MNDDGNHTDDLDLGFDLRFDKRASRSLSAGGTWVSGTIHDHRFEALVFPEHAGDPDWEIGDSGISKLWVQRLADQQEVYNWDRGPDVPAQTTTAAAIVDFLCAGLAQLTYGE